MAAYFTRSSSGTSAKIASISDDFPAAVDDWMITASGASSFRDTAPR